MTTLTDFKRSAQLPLNLVLADAEMPAICISTPIDTEIAEADQDPGRNGHDCQVEGTCHTNHGLNGASARSYVCGFRISGKTWGCPRRKRGGHPPVIVARPEPEPVVKTPRLPQGGKRCTGPDIVILHHQEFRPPQRW